MHHLVPDIVTLLKRPFGTQVKRGHVEEYDRFNKEIVYHVGKQDFYQSVSNCVGGRQHSCNMWHEYYLSNVWLMCYF